MSMPGQERSLQVAKRLAEWRQGLLDTRRTNRLLYFRAAKSRVLRLTEPGSSVIFDRLAKPEAELTFHLSGPLDDDLDDYMGDGSAREVPLQQHLPFPAATLAGLLPLQRDEVRAEVAPERLAVALYRLRQRARSSLEERGVNTLYVTFGMLHWKETPAAAEMVQSPLLLVPVSLKRKSALDPYRLTLFDEEEIALNPTLVECLRKDFGVDLTLPDPEGDVDLDWALEAIRDQVRRQVDWRVTDDVYLGHFSFVKLVMYKDLEANAAQLTQHPLVRALAGDHAALPASPGDLPTEADLDRNVPPAATYHILDADSSQLEALTAADRGASIIIQGPPGTGKSQTIANLIAQALAQGKRVLFVSEKMAALEVVYRRIKDAGLASLCLELHSHHSNKKAVLSQFDLALKAIDPGAPSAEAFLSLEELKQRREALNAYVTALHDAQTPLGISAFQAHGEVARREFAPDTQFTYHPCATTTPTDLAKLINLVVGLSSVGEVLLGLENHPWRGTRIAEYSLRLQGEIRSRFGDLREAVGEAAGLAARLIGGWGLIVPSSLRDLRWQCALLEMLAVSPRPPIGWFGVPSLEALEATARNQAERHAEHERRRAALLIDYEESLFALDHADLHHRLTYGATRALAPLSTVQVDQAEFASINKAALSGHLDRVISALEAVQTISPNLASKAGLATPATTIEARALIQAVDFLLRNHRPPSAWLDLSAALTRRALATKACEHASTRWVDGRALEAEYDSALLAEAGDLAARYEHYGTFLRVLRPGYWRDSSRLKKLARSGKRPGVSEAIAVLHRARSIAAAGAWLDEHQAELARSLGQHPAFVGEGTDWESVLAATGTALEVLREFGEAGVPPAYSRILSAGSDGLEPLRSLHRRLAAALADLDSGISGLTGLVVLDEVADMAGNMAAATAALRAWREGLGGFWQAEAATRVPRRSPTARSVAGLVQDLAETGAVSTLAAAIAADGPRLSQLFGRFYAGLSTDWAKLLAALEWTGRVREHFGPEALPAEFSVRVASPERYSLPSVGESRRLVELLDRIDRGLAYVREVFEESAFRLGGHDLEAANLGDLTAWLDQRLDSLGGLECWLDFAAARRKCDDAGLGGFVADLERLRPPVGTWRDALLKRFYQLWLDARYAAVPVLRDFRGSRHESLREEFRRSDRAVLQLARLRIQHQVLSQRPSFDSPGDTWAATGEPAILRRELNKRKRHKPIRRLFCEIPNLLLALTPCLMMSPLSVSQYLASERLRFDLVIFDEASQVMPQDAVGSIFRGAQLVVAGDQRQLPPTRFFERQVEAGDKDEEREAGDEDEDAGETMESILDKCDSIGMSSKVLRWHYRSKDERLIAFSNHYFYDGRLITFPSSDQARPGYGVEFVHVPDGVYDRGNSRTNRIEARKVVDLILEHARQQLNRPEQERRTLGVVAFSASQMDAIHQELERTLRSHLELEGFFREDQAEPFFVKNLETVQGDERDVIFFSLGYGKDAAGRFFYNFGPLVQSGGERRLNVAVSRAREHVKFVSSVHPTELDPVHLTSEGAKLLRAYMDFVLKGPVALAKGLESGGGPAESVFEEAVGTDLEKQGLKIQRQVGCSGYRIDLAVVDPERPGRYLLGVECDGATYHRSKVARDRDRLRQQVLEGLGWRIHRVWSQDWVKDPRREIRRILDALERAQPGEPPTQRTPPGGDEGVSPRHYSGVAPARKQASTDLDLAAPGIASPPLRPHTATQKRMPYVEAKLPQQRDREGFYADTAVYLVIPKLVASCVEVEWPVHVDRVVEVVAGCWGFQRVGDRIARQVRDGIAEAVKQRLVECREDFLWKPGQDRSAVRIRTGGPACEVRPVAEVALEELGRAAVLLVDENFSLPVDDLVVRIARFLGYGRLIPPVAKERIRTALESEIREGTLVDSDGRISRGRNGA